MPNFGLGLFLGWPIGSRGICIGPTNAEFAMDPASGFARIGTGSTSSPIESILVSNNPLQLGPNGLLVDGTDAPGVNVSAELPLNAPFGRLTREGHGGVAVTGSSISSGDPSGHWQIVSNVLTPSATGEDNLLASYQLTLDDGQVVDIATEADTYSIAESEFSAVIGIGTPTLDGKTIKGRPGADILGTTAGSVLTLPNTLSFSTGLTVTAHDVSNPPNMRRLIFRHGGTVTFSQIKIEDQMIPATDTLGSAAIFSFANNTVGRSGVVIDKCECVGGDINDYNPALIFTGTGSTSGSSTTVTFTGSPDLSGIPENGQAYMRNAGTGVRRIDSVDNVAKTITVFPAIDITSASTIDVGHNPNVLRIVTTQGGISSSPDLTVNDSYFHDMERAVTGLYRFLDFQRNLTDNVYGDHCSWSITGTETRFRVRDNVARAAFGRGSDPLNPHVDAYQVNLGPMTQANTVPLEFIGNRIWPAGSRGGTQGIFIENFNASRFDVTADIRHNMIMTDSRNGITLETGGSDSFIRFNTLVYNVDAPDSSSFSPFVLTTDDEGTINVRGNAAHSISVTGQTATEALTNHVWTGITNADFSTLLTGSTFGADVYTTLTSWTAAMTPATGEALDTSEPKIGAGSYYTYDNSAVPSGSKSNIGAGLANDPTVPDAFYDGQYTIAQGSADTEIDVTIVSLPYNAGSAITDLEYRLDAGSWVSVGSTTNFTITGLTADTEYDVDVRAVNANGSGFWDVSSRKTVTTSGGAYSANATEFETGEFMHDNTLTTTSAASRVGMISMWVYFDGTIPTAAPWLDMRESGGGQRVTINGASSGRMNVILRNSSNTIIGQAVPATGGLTVNAWNHILISWDSNTGTERFQIYIDDAVPSFSISPTITADEEVDAIARFGVPGTAAQTVDLWYSDVWVTLSESLDLSVESNRRFFRDASGKPVDLGSNGSTPTGNAPFVFYRNGFATFNQDESGNNNDLAVTGTLSAAPSSPSD